MKTETTEFPYALLTLHTPEKKSEDLLSVAFGSFLDFSRSRPNEWHFALLHPDEPPVLAWDPDQPEESEELIREVIELMRASENARN